MKNERTVLVCVTVQSSSENLIRAGKAMAVKNSADLEIVSVIPVDEERGSFDPEALDRLYSCAKAHGGEMAVYFSDDPIMTVCAHVAKRKPLTLVTGFPGEKSNNFISLIHLILPEVPISMVDPKGTVYNMLPSESTKQLNH
ncbi:MAG: hypothetical protein IIX36_01315 [Clostridia bacterium]|nr:hypothetical protein [Clostridia bacterium]